MYEDQYGEFIPMWILELKGLTTSNQIHVLTDPRRKLGS